MIFAMFTPEAVITVQGVAKEQRVLVPLVIILLPLPQNVAFVLSVVQHELPARVGIVSPDFFGNSPDITCWVFWASVYISWYSQSFPAKTPVVLSTVQVILPDALAVPSDHTGSIVQMPFPLSEASFQSVVPFMRYCTLTLVASDGTSVTVNVAVLVHKSASLLYVIGVGIWNVSFCTVFCPAKSVTWTSKICVLPGAAPNFTSGTRLVILKIVDFLY